jgi:ankyrin repeat protein
LKSLWIIAASPLLGGCWLPFGIVEVRWPDPLRKKAVRIAGASGRTFTLADGRKIKLAGIDVEFDGLDPFHEKDVHWDIAFRASMYHVVVADESEQCARLIHIDMTDKTRYYGPVCPLLGASELLGSAEYHCSAPIGILIPILVERKPYRFDLGSSLIFEGLAKPRLEEIDDPQLREEYVEAVERAREKRRGMWMGKNERLAEATWRGHIESVKILLDAGADPDWAMTPAACGRRGAEILRVALAAGGNPNLKHARNGTTPLHAAAEVGNLECAALLLEHGADINAVANDYSGPFTPVVQAIRCRQAEMVRFLLEKGADLNVAGGPETALHPFCRPAGLEMVELLIAHGADPNGVHRNQTPLHVAARDGAPEVAAFLVSRGADLEAKNSSDNTPLHQAVESRRAEIVELLIAKGADVNARGNGNLRPLTMARWDGQEQIAKILRDHGARN